VARDLAALDADRDAAVDRLRAEKVRQEAFLASIGDGVFAIDRAWNVTLWNRSAEHITGWSSAETVGRPLRDAMTFVREKDGTENVAFIEEVMLRGETRTMENGSLLVTKDGRRVPVADSAAPVFRGATGAVDGAIVVFRDVSAEHTLKDREREIARLKDEFLFRTVHDLQSPVTGIRLALGLHAEQEAAAGAAPALRQGIAAIQDACGRMASLIDDLLKVARGEESSLALRREPVDVDAMVDAVLAQARPQMEARRVTASRSGGPLRAMADADGLKEVLENLVSNAVKYNRDGGEVTVTLSDAEGQARVTVHDTGIGIGPDDLRRLFRPYFRAGGGDVKGTGLGLYIVKKLLDKMGGSVAAESVPGKGTAFTVSLPKA
jgi:PAS domain S-box-containing protein